MRHNRVQDEVPRRRSRVGVMILTLEVRVESVKKKKVYDSRTIIKSRDWTDSKRHVTPPSLCTFAR